MEIFTAEHAFLMAKFGLIYMTIGVFYLMLVAIIVGFYKETVTKDEFLMATIWPVSVCNFIGLLLRVAYEQFKQFKK